jgi:hypothetical protein
MAPSPPRASLKIVALNPPSGSSAGCRGPVHRGGRQGSGPQHELDLEFAWTRNPSEAARLGDDSREPLPRSLGPPMGLLLDERMFTNECPNLHGT